MDWRRKRGGGRGWEEGGEKREGGERKEEGGEKGGGRDVGGGERRGEERGEEGGRGGREGEGKGRGKKRGGKEGRREERKRGRRGRRGGEKDLRDKGLLSKEIARKNSDDGCRTLSSNQSRSRGARFLAVKLIKSFLAKRC